MDEGRIKLFSLCIQMKDSGFYSSGLFFRIAYGLELEDNAYEKVEEMFPFFLRTREAICIVEFCC